MTGTISFLHGATAHLDALSAGSVPTAPSKVSAVSTPTASSVTTVRPPVDPQHQVRLQALAHQVQSGQYQVQPQKVAAAWLKAAR